MLDEIIFDPVSDKYRTVRGLRIARYEGAKVVEFEVVSARDENWTNSLPYGLFKEANKNITLQEEMRNGTD